MDSAGEREDQNARLSPAAHGMGISPPTSSGVELFATALR